MATLYAKAAGGNWSAAGTWSNVSSAGGDSSGPPTAADNVVFNSGSGNVTINSTAVCRSLDCNGYTGTLTHNSSVTLSIGDGTAGTSNIALRLATGMTYTKVSLQTSAVSFISTSGTQQTVTSNGKTFSNVTFGGSGSSYQLADAITTSSVASFTHTAGTLDLNGKTVTVGTFTCSGTTRTLTCGAATISVLNNSFTLNATSLTLNTGTSTISSSTTNFTFSGGGGAYYDLTLTGGGSITMSGANSFHDLTITGTAAKTDSFKISASITVSGTLALNGNSTVNRLLLSTNIAGDNYTVTSATNSFSNLDIMDITGAGAASWSLASITGNSGDCGGNSGITFTTSATQTANGTTSFNWSTAARWTSRVPLPQDDVIVNNSFSTNQTVTLDMPRLGRDVSFSGAANTPTVSNPDGIAVYGSLNLSSIGTLTMFSGTELRGRGTHTITSNGKPLRSPGIYAVGGSYTLADDLGANGSVAVSNGTFNAASYNLSMLTFISTSGKTRTVSLGSGTWTLTSTGSVWNVSATGLTITAGTAEIIINNTTASAKTFAGAGFTYPDLTITGDAVSITGSNTFATLAVNNAGLTTGLSLQTSNTQTVTGFTTNGSAGNLAILKSSSAGTIANIAKAGAPVRVDYMSIKDSKAIGGASWFAGANSTNVSNNFGWIFNEIPQNVLTFSNPF